MKHIKTFILLFACFVFASCSSSDSGGGGSSSVAAPSALTGKIYRMTITSGGGILAITGTYTVNFSSTQNTYIVTGDGVNVADSAGSYTYSTNGNIGLASVLDASFSTGSFAFSFTSATGGTFLATVTSDPNSSQTGSFVQL